MTRYAFAFSLLFALSPIARAQDMPLAQILIPGEDWKKVPNATKPKSVGEPTGITSDAPWKTAAIQTPDGCTVFVAFNRGSFLHAHAIGKDGALQPGHPYAPLRTRRGEKEIGVTSLAVDQAGRIYAATEIGVQVFDPTGRMCGVLTPAAPGLPQALAFEGDQLTLWIGNTKYTRALRTAGAR
jgi:hypothetical protein